MYFSSRSLFLNGHDKMKTQYITSKRDHAKFTSQHYFGGHVLLREGERERERQGDRLDSLLTDKRNASNFSVNMMCDFANLLENRPCCLSSCPFMII